MVFASRASKKRELSPRKGEKHNSNTNIRIIKCKNTKEKTQNTTKQAPAMRHAGICIYDGWS